MSRMLNSRVSFVLNHFAYSFLFLQQNFQIDDFKIMSDFLRGKSLKKSDFNHSDSTRVKLYDTFLDCIKTCTSDAFDQTTFNEGVVYENYEGMFFHIYFLFIKFFLNSFQLL